MNHDGLVMPGTEPWAPSPDVTDLDIWDVQDVPTAGVFRVPEGAVLFTALGELSERTGVWAYAFLTEDEVEAFGDIVFDDVFHLQRTLDDVFDRVNRKVVIATSRSFLISHWGVKIVGKEGVLRAANDFLDEVIRTLSQARSPEGREELDARSAMLEALEPALV